MSSLATSGVQTDDHSMQITYFQPLQGDQLAHHPLSNQFLSRLRPKTRKLDNVKAKIQDKEVSQYIVKAKIQDNKVSQWIVRAKIQDSIQVVVQLVYR